MKSKKSIIRTYRTQNNLTQEELGNKLGVSRQTVNNWESGLYNPSEKLLIELAKVFGISPDKLFEEYADEARAYKLNFKPSSVIRLYESPKALTDKSPEAIITVNYEDPMSLIALRIQDDTVEAFKLLKGSIAIIRTKGMVMSGTIVLLSINHEPPKIAKITTDGDYLTLSYGSEKYPDEKYDLYRTSVDVIGRVIGYLGDL